MYINLSDGINVEWIWISCGSTWPGVVGIVGGAVWDAQKVRGPLVKHGPSDKGAFFDVIRVRRGARVRFR